MCPPIVLIIGWLNSNPGAYARGALVSISNITFDTLFSHKFNLSLYTSQYQYPSPSSSMSLSPFPPCLSSPNSPPVPSHERPTASPPNPGRPAPTTAWITFTPTPLLCQTHVHNGTCHNKQYDCVLATADVVLHLLQACSPHRVLCQGIDSNSVPSSPMLPPCQPTVHHVVEPPPNPPHMRCHEPRIQPVTHDQLHHPQVNMDRGQSIRPLPDQYPSHPRPLLPCPLKIVNHHWSVVVLH